MRERVIGNLSSLTYLKSYVVEECLGIVTKLTIKAYPLKKADNLAKLNIGKSNQGDCRFSQAHSHSIRATRKD